MWGKGDFEMFVGLLIGSGAVGGLLAGVLCGWLIWG